MEEEYEDSLFTRFTVNDIMPCTQPYLEAIEYTGEHPKHISRFFIEHQETKYGCDSNQWQQNEYSFCLCTVSKEGQQLQNMWWHIVSSHYDIMLLVLVSFLFVYGLTQTPYHQDEEHDIQLHKGRHKQDSDSTIARSLDFLTKTMTATGAMNRYIV